MTIHDIGDVRTLSCALTDAQDDPIDPTVLTFEVREPDGTVTTLVYTVDIEVTRDGVGEYHVDWLCAQAGAHYWGFTASGNVGAAEESTFLVRSSNITDPNGCTWPVDTSCLPALPALSSPPTDEELDAYSTAEISRAAAEDLAVQVLWSLSGRQFGVCETLARPCPTPTRYAFPYRTVYSGLPSDPFIPLYVNGAWRNYSCGCAGRCILGGPRAVHLPGPAQEIVEVAIGDEILTEDQYTLQGNILYRIGDIWPSQNLGLPLYEDGTWAVTYLRGLPVPAGVDKFTGLLAKEFLAACSGDSCRLPRNVVSTSSRGVSRQFDPSRIYAMGKTGLSEIDLWLSAINPAHIMSAPSVL